MNRRHFITFCAAVGVGAVGIEGTGACHAATGATVKAFDKAFHDDGASPAWYRDAYAAGYRLMVLSSNIWGRNVPWAGAPGQLGLALDAGLKIAAYTRNPNWWRVGIEACAPYIGQLQFFCLDIEIDPGIPVTRTMVDGVRAMGVRPVIYSGSGMWPKIMSNDTSFADLPLWDAAHGSPGPVPYGGWNTPDNMRVGVQQTEGAYFNGVEINISSFSAGFLGL
jgi:hypothetical protein